MGFISGQTVHVKIVVLFLILTPSLIKAPRNTDVVPPTLFCPKVSFSKFVSILLSNPAPLKVSGQGQNEGKGFVRV